MAFSGDFTPVLAKHSKSLNLLDSISVGVDRMQRNFAPMQKQVESWQGTELSNVSAKMIVYEAFIESELDVPKHLVRRVHDFYFEPQYEEFRARTLWSLSNAFTSAFKELDPIPQFKATAKLAEFRFALDHPCGRASPAWGEKQYPNSNLAVYCQIHPKPWFDTSAASSLSVPASM